MSRPSIDEVMIRAARVWAERSTCSRLHVGAVAAREGRVIASGYNGVVSGAPHCDHTCRCRENYYADDPDYAGEHAAICPAINPCRESVHAEANVIAFAARWGSSLQGTTLYCTHAPCVECAKLIVNSGITDVIFAKFYRNGNGLELLMNNGVTVGPWMKE